MKLNKRTHWIFDMDGTLTVGIHDFEAIRTALGLPLAQPILETIAALPEAEASVLRQRLNEIELDLARQSKPQSGARELLTGLKQRGMRLGILTRNTRPNAFETLGACDLLDFFEPEFILGRESAAPKPSPEGIHKLLGYWGAQPGAAVMVGDYRFDLEAGRRAGTTTVYVDVAGKDLWTAQADLRVQNLSELLSFAVVGN